MITKVDFQKDIIEINEHFRNPITENTSVILIGHAISFQNMGETTVMIDSVQTLLPKSTKTLAVPFPNMLYVQKYQISFVGEGVNRLEISETQIKGCDYSNYQKQ